MTAVDPILAGLVARIEDVELPCMVVGSVAAMVWGEPRSTLDIDVVVNATEVDAERLAAAFPEQLEYYVPPLATIREELRRGSRGSFNIIDPSSGLKIDLYPLGNDPLNHYGMARRTPLEVDGVGMIFIAPPSCIIAGKLRFYAMSHQDKHLRDIRAMLRMNGIPEDRAVIDEWAAQTGVTSAWHDCLARPGAE